MKEEFENRFNCARRHRERDEAIMREATKFLFNGSECDWDKSVKRGHEAEEIFDTEAAESNEEFTSDLFQYMTPDTVSWVKFEVSSTVPEEFKEEVDAIIEDHSAAIENAIEDSNYYHEGPVAFQSAGIGNVAMWVDTLNPARPAVCEAIPLNECFFTVGPNGLEDRFRKTSYYARDIPVMFPDYDFDKKLALKIKEGKSDCVVIRGFWRDYSDPGNPRWKGQVKIDGQYFPVEDIGEEGACPFLAGRYGAKPRRAWGVGPALKMLPKIRTLDVISQMVLEGMDRTLDPAYTYPHDGMLDLSDGIEPGQTYPMMPGTEGRVEPIGGANNMDYGFFIEETMRQIIRKGFYRPDEQKGKTPPSASQYLGDEQKPIRRMIKPASKVWDEFVQHLIKRFEYLEVQAGRLDIPMIGSDVIKLRPISPLQRAQSREAVITAQGIMAMATEALGEQAPLVIDGPRTIKNIKTELGDNIVEVRTEDQIMAAMQAMNGQQQTEGPGPAQAKAGV